MRQLHRGILPCRIPLPHALGWRSRMKMILTYHSIDASGSPISIAPGIFRSHVSWLAESGHSVVPLHEIAALPDDVDAIALAFDDAFANFAEIAAPILFDAALPATIFVVTDRAGMTNAWHAGADDGVPVLPLLRWDEIAAVAEAGIEIGAHTRSHPDLTRLSSTDQLTDEIVGSGAEIERRTGRRPKSFAYPYGQNSSDVTNIVRNAYEYGCTTEMRDLTSRDDRALMPRVDAWYFRRPGLLESWGTRRFTGYMRARALGRRVRRTLAGLGGTK